jgi:hypothetical protein
MEYGALEKNNIDAMLTECSMSSIIAFVEPEMSRGIGD